MAIRKPFEIPLREVQKRMALENPWWVAGAGIDPERRGWPKRAYFIPFLRLLRGVEVHRAVVLIGPRRVGKTVMLAQAVQALLDDGVAGIDILQLSLVRRCIRGARWKIWCARLSICTATIRLAACGCFSMKSSM